MLNIIKNKVQLFHMWLVCIGASIAVLPYIAYLQQEALSFGHIILYLVQNSIMYAIASFGGAYFVSPAGFSVLYKKDNKRAAIIGIIIGFMLGLFLLFFDFCVFRLPLQGSYIPWYFRFLASFYGAINEEVLNRYFFMSFFMWLLQKITGRIAGWMYWLSIGVAALLFGILHLPIAFQALNVTPFYVFRILLLNGISGMTFGYLFWQYGLVTSIIAHFVADIVIHVLVLFFV